MKRTLIALAVAASLAALTGCGGSSDTTTDTQSVSLSGTAAKGIIQNGVVTATELSSTGAELGVVGTATTDAKGHYQLTLNDTYQGGVVQLTLTAGLDTKMICDATEGCGTDALFGSTVSLGAGFSLNAIVQPDANSQTVSAQITPLTHMANARVFNKGGEINAASVDAAISEVSQIVGVNIMESETVDITSSESLANASDESKKLALFNAGLANLLVAGNDSVSGNIERNLANLASSFEDGQFDANDAVKMTEITTAVAIALTYAKTNNEINASLTKALADTQTAVDLITSNTVNDIFNPEPSDSAGESDRDKGKALLTNARTFIETIAADFKDPLDALAIDTKTVGEALDADSAIMAELLGVAIDQTLTDLDRKIVDFTLVDNNYTTDITDSKNEKIGSITTSLRFYDSGMAITLNGQLVGDLMSVDITNLTLATNLTKDALTISPDKSLLNAITAQTADVMLTGFIGNSVTSLTLNGVELSLSATDEVTIDTTAGADNSGLETEISGASFSGGLLIQSADASFAGDAQIELVGFANSASEVPLNLKTMVVNGEFTSFARGSFAAGAKLTIDNATTFDTFGYFDYESTAYEWVEFDYNLTASDLAIVEAAVADVQDGAEFTNIYYNSWNGAYEASYTYLATDVDDFGYTSSYSDYGNVSIDNLANLEAAVITVVENKVNDTVESSEIDYLNYSLFQWEYNQKMDNWERIESSNVNADVKLTFPDFESADNFVKGTISVTAKVNVPELPEATAIASVSRTALAGGNASVVVSYDGQSFTLTANSEDIDATEPKATLTLSNPDGVKLIINLIEKIDGEQYIVDGELFVNGTRIGTVSETDSGIPLIRYTDGRFASLY
ncbi:hypothetical protein CXF72_17650 [Psychromonas sp. MB-3u-54]|uniref:hypothetical protein n=1 Tax=Psychromonas sp. MB-3u-54 TaxID=2058319 RepID=UPI000C338068|nr:hypothetical protein [Psychromonas sp. MB-3u-54]PKH01239.1 hypothetical protein CXF72_17650 [Psychromonas sp. MB-3u-54]